MRLALIRLITALVVFLGAALLSAQDKKLIIGYTARDLNNFPLLRPKREDSSKKLVKQLNWCKFART